MITQIITQPITYDESFYLERFKRSVLKNSFHNGRIVDEDFHCELYKGFAIVDWKREIQQPSGATTVNHSLFVWEVGGFHDKFTDLSWVSQGVITWGYGAESLDKSLKKVKKKLDLLSLAYSRKSELQQLSFLRPPRVAYDSPSVFNARVGDEVSIRAFGRTRVGIIVSTTGSRFVVAYMTPTNAVDVHYKILPLNSLYPKE